MMEISGGASVVRLGMPKAWQWRSGPRGWWRHAAARRRRSGGRPNLGYALAYRGIPLAPPLMEIHHQAPQNEEEDVHHKYHSTLWGDFFLHHVPCSPSQYLMMKDKVEIMKGEVKKMLLDVDSFGLSVKLDFIDTLERLGLDYHYTTEIDKLMCNLFKARDQDLDLTTTSHLFYLLRKHGYHISSDVFLKFRDDKGKIITNDARCLLRMYEAAHLRVKGEEILDNILIFTKSQLQCVVDDLEPQLKEEVKYALETPIFRRLKRVQARQYISIYENNTTHNKMLLEFSKLDFNILLTLYCEELKDLTFWWKEFQTQANTSIYARDRMVEMHFWMMGVFFEPQYSYSRKMLTQLFMIVSVLDDLYDNHCTTEEGKVFTVALQRFAALLSIFIMFLIGWDEQAVEQCPTYLRTLYKNIFSTIKAIEVELNLQNNKHAKLVKRLVCLIIETTKLKRTIIV